MTERRFPIAYLTGEYPRATDTFIQREVTALRGLGWPVTTCSIRATAPEHHVGPEQQAEAAATFNVIRAARNPATALHALGRALARPGRLWSALRLAFRTRPPGVRGLLWQLFYLAEAMVLSAELQARGVRHLHNHIAKASCTVAMLTSELSEIPYSFTLHGPDIFFEPMHWRLDEKIARARFVACISHFCRSQGMAFSDAAHWPRLHIIHCGVEPGRYRSAKRDPGGPAVFVGRLAAVKGLPVLFDAVETMVQQNPGFRLLMVGDGPDRAALEKRASGLPVEFLGYRSQADVAELLSGASMLVLPSFAEGVPVVLMEAMAAGLPVVATRIAGIPELVEDGVSGHVIPPGDARPLARAMADLLVDAARADAMGQAGRAHVVTHYDARQEAARLSTLITGYDQGQTPSIRPEPEP